MKEQELSALKESAVDSDTHWAKTGLSYFTMRDKVNDYTRNILDMLDINYQDCKPPDSKMFMTDF